MIDLFPVDGLKTGALAIALRPRGGDWLADEMLGLARSKYSVLVSALQNDEMEELGLTDEGPAAIVAGISFHRFPIADRSSPEVEPAIALALRLVDQLELGAHVAVHCRQGIGRSALLVAAVLVASGHHSETAWGLVATARKRPVPDTDDQRAWLQLFEQKFRAR